MGGAVLGHGIRFTARARHRCVLLPSDYPPHFAAREPVSQIAYGAETATDGLLSLGRATGKDVYWELGGIAATWFFGNNPANSTIYQQPTGVVYDGINGDGTVNHNSGAESTIEGLLAVMSVANAQLTRSYLRYDHVAAQSSYQKVEAESGGLSGGAAVVKPASAWTGEALWSNSAYVDIPHGGSVSIATNAPSGGQYAVTSCLTSSWCR